MFASVGLSDAKSNGIAVAAGFRVSTQSTAFWVRQPVDPRLIHFKYQTTCQAMCQTT